MSGSDNDNGNMDVTAESIIALVGIVLALPPCIVLVWKWRVIRRALRRGEHTLPVAEAPQEAVRRLSMDDVMPILPLHHNRRAMTNSSTNTNGSAATSTDPKASSTFTNASSTTDVSVSPEEPSARSSKASSITTISESPEKDSSREESGTVTTTTPPSFVTNLIGMTKNLLQEGDNLSASPQRIELVVVEGKVQSIHLLCRTKLSPLFRIPGYPYSLESPV
ncbi:hypothetical protein PG996_004246 [Apiospora saccharicola]|uniref:Uncharacterized protein n=1 Tax=Apiospora saccharicola TaxID=335842 RepID=A0ABR1W3J2_9PEZI